MARIDVNVDGVRREDEVEPRTCSCTGCAKSSAWSALPSAATPPTAAPAPSCSTVAASSRAACWPCRPTAAHHHDPGPGQRRMAPGADRLQGVPRPAVRLLHPGHGARRRRPADREPRPRPTPRSGRVWRATSVAAPATRTSSSRSATRQSPCRSRGGREMTELPTAQSHAPADRTVGPPQGGRPAAHRRHQLDRQHPAARARCTWCSCAARTPTPGSPGSTCPPRWRCPAWSPPSMRPNSARPTPRCCASGRSSRTSSCPSSRPWRRRGPARRRLRGGRAGHRPVPGRGRRRGRRGRLRAAARRHRHGGGARRRRPTWCTPTPARNECYTKHYALRRLRQGRRRQ